MVSLFILTLDVIFFAAGLDEVILLVICLANGLSYFV